MASGEGGICAASAENANDSPEHFEQEPLEKLKLRIVKDGEIKMVSALHIGWMEVREYVSYFCPAVSQDNNNWDLMKESHREWLLMMDILNEDLQWLLKLKHHRFWSQVVYDVALHSCLVSFLKYSPRPYELDNFLKDEEMLEEWKTAYRRVFLVYLRMATYKESKSCHITPQMFGKLIYNNYLFDIPMLMDLCVLYGDGNRQLLYKMISNIFTHQPAYMNDLQQIAISLLKVYDMIMEELGVIDTCGEPVSLKSSRKNKKLDDYMDLAVYIVDAAMSLNIFLDVYAPASFPFHQTGFEVKIASFYELAVPAITAKLREILVIGDERQKTLCMEILKRLRTARLAFVNTFRNLLVSCCIQPLLGASDSKDVTCRQHAEDFIQVLSSCVSEKLFMCDYDLQHPFAEDLHLLSQAGVSIDKTRTDYLSQAISTAKEGMQLQKDEWVEEGDAEIELMPQCNGTSDDIEECELEASNTVRMSGVELDSLISRVKDLLPELGDGFVEECLKFYNYNDEAVINALLDDSLPKKLSALDRTMAKKREDVVLVDSLSERINVFDYDEFDVYHRDDVDTSQIHKGKKEEYKDFKELFDDKTLVKDTKESYAVFGSVEVSGSYYDTQYDDEYDDTYDDVAVGQEEPDAQDWIRPLNTKMSKLVVEPEPEEDESQSSESQLKPRDCFVPNPEELREKAELRRKERMHKSHRRPPVASADTQQPDSSAAKETGAKPKQQPSGAGGKQSEAERRKKAAQKSSRANHNRKAQAQWKRGKGMLPI